MNNEIEKSKIVIFSCLLFALMAIHIIGILESSGSQVQHQSPAIAAFNG